MEEPLLDQASSSKKARTSWKKVVNVAVIAQSRLDSVLSSRQAALLYGDNVEKAAALIDQAMEGKGIPPEYVGQADARDAVRAYALYRQLSGVFFYNSIALLCLSFFEIPLWCKGQGPQPCGNPSLYLLSPLPKLSRAACLAIEAICIAIMCFQVHLQQQYRGVRSGPRPLRIAKLLTLAVLVFETLALAALLMQNGSSAYPAVRMGPYARILAFVFLDMEVTKFFGLVLSVMARFIDQGILVILFIVFSTWIGRVLFLNTLEGDLYFKSFKDAVGNMAFLITAVNSPEMWIPAYQQSPISAIFFVTFLFLGMYIFMGILCGVVFGTYKEKLADDVVKQLSHRSMNLRRAFDLLDEKHEGCLHFDAVCKLLEALKRYLRMPSISHEEMKYMFSELDKSGDLKLDLDEFEEIVTIVCLEFEPVEPDGGIIERTFPHAYHSGWLSKLRQFVLDPLFNKIIYALLLFNGIVIAVETELEAVSSPYQRPMQFLEVGLSWVYVVELILEVFSYGFARYWGNIINRFDCVATLLMIGVQLLVFQIIPNHVADLHWIRYMLILQLLRLAGGLVYIQRYSTVIKSAYRCLPALKPLIGVLFCLLMAYNTFAVQAFGGLMKVNSPELKGTKYLALNYLPHNFNDFPTGMITMFDLMIGHNWSVFMAAYVKLTGTEWTRIFFVSFFVVAVSFSVKLVLSFILAGFLSQMKALANGGHRASKVLERGGVRIQVKEPGRLRHIELLKEILSSEVKAAALRQQAKEQGIT